MPKLAETIDYEDLPDTLFVHDPNDICRTHKLATTGISTPRERPLDYDELEERMADVDGRFFPKADRDSIAGEQLDGDENEASAEEDETTEETSTTEAEGKTKEPQEIVRVYSRFTFSKPNAEGMVRVDKTEQPLELKGPKWSLSSGRTKLPDENDPSLGRVAHLWLRKEEKVGVGHHSSVYRAEFRIRKSVLYQPDEDLPDSGEY